MTNETVYQTLQQQLSASHVEIDDFSWQHAGHAGMPQDPSQMGGTHLRVTVVSDKFTGVSLIDRHRMVHDTLKDAFARHLHALELKTYTPDEWAKTSLPSSP